MSRKESGSNAPKTIDLSTLSPKQLAAIREQLEVELNNYMQSNIALQRAASDFHASGRAIEQLSEQEKGCSGCQATSVSPCAPAGKQLLLPLTSSVYVHGELESVEKVLIDVGTGYFVEVRRSTVCILMFSQSFNNHHANIRHRKAPMGASTTASAKCSF